MDEKTMETGAKKLSDIFADISEFERGYLVASRGVLRGLMTPLVEQMGFGKDTSVPFDALDACCGTGLFTQEIQDVVPKDVLEKSSFLGFDNSQQMVDMTSRRIQMENWINVKTAVLDAKNTGLPDNSFSHVGLGMSLHLIPGPDEVIEECKRLLKPGGAFGATTFTTDTKFWIPGMRAAFASFPFPAPFPEQFDMQWHKDGHWTEADWVEEHLKELGLVDVKVTQNPGKYHLRDADEFITSFSSMITWVHKSSWDEETQEAHPAEEVVGLVKKYFEDKYEGKGWDIDWTTISMTARVEK